VSKVLYTSTAPPEGWVLVGPAQDEIVSVKVALKQQNLDLLNQEYNARSDPDSEFYGKWLSIEEILDIVAPSIEDHNKVFDWLEQNQVRVVSLRDALHVEASATSMGRLFQVKMFHMRHLQSGRVVIRAIGQVVIPDSVVPYVQMITGLVDYPQPRGSSFKNPPEASSVWVIPASLRTVYSVPSDYQISSNSSQCVVEFDNAPAYSPKDLTQFYTTTATPAQASPKIVGPFHFGISPAKVECTLDIQYVTGVGQGAENWYWTVKSWMYEFAVGFFNTPVVPYVNSMSWGYAEADQCQVDGNCTSYGFTNEQYVMRTNVEFQKIGLRGVSLLAASGDDGANDNTNVKCTKPTLMPDFPASSPYVTAVGATQFQTATTSTTLAPACASMPCATSGTEEAVSYQVAGFTSGGGFSNYEPTQSWQQAAVSAYLSSGVQLPPASYFNASGRAYPDVAALGNNFIITSGGSNTQVGGTSAASPTFAAIVAILNDYRFKNGGAALGPLNPLLYKMSAEQPSTFQDITTGNNICTEAGCARTCKGYVCAKGWDPVTGLGTPNTQEMISYLQSLDARNAARRN
jgi:tripeptidyl-peptidase-1